MTDENTPEPDPTAKRQQMDAIRLDFRTGQGDVPPLHDTPVPRRLYHYTTLGGLMGIVPTSTLWASDARFLNDSSELSYAAQLVDDVVAEAISGVTNEVLRDTLPSRPGFANGFEYGARPFVACFCEEGDLLSQWRGYAAGETGYSLGLDLSIATYELPPHTYPRKVIYDQEQQRDSVRAVVDAWLTTAQALLDPDRGLRSLSSRMRRLVFEFSERPARCWAC